MAVTFINYNDGDKDNLGYKSVEIHYGKDEKKIFATKNFVRDWYEMRKFMIVELLETESHFIHSSTVDNFLMDGAPYDSAYLHTTDEGEPIFKYIDRSDLNYLVTQEDIYEGIEFFVLEGTQPTFEELKEICK